MPTRTKSSLSAAPASLWTTALLCLSTLCGASAARAQQLVLSPYNATGIYKLGEKVGWTVTLPDGATLAPGDYTYTVKKNNFDVIQSGKLDLTSGKATIECSLNEPAMVYVQITTPPPAADNAANPAPAPGPGRGFRRRRPIAAGAAIAPTQLRPAAPRPADFDAFWADKIKSLEAIPANPVLTPGDSGNPDVEYDTITMDHVNGTHVHGQLAKPTKPGKYPALLLLQWASPPYPLQKGWVIGHAADGWLTLNIEPHDVLPDQPQDYYAALPAALKNYASIASDDRDKSYFVEMYLRDYRAVDYLASRPDWDGKTLVVMGTSMGGQQSLCVAGLHPRITHMIVEEPSGCDMDAPLYHHQSGYPNFPADNPKVMATAPYVDAINFASHITATSLVAMGFIDTTAPPTGIWTAFDQIKGPKEVAPMIRAPHNNMATQEEQRPFNDRSTAWLKTLVAGGQVTPDTTVAEQR